jgi:O-antigen/teichoic acid export membrane protein
MTSQAFTYVLIGALPILVGVTCIASPLVRLIYGAKYLPAIPVLVVVALFSIPKAVLTPAQTLLYSAEDLGFILKWGCVAGLADVLLDIALIPHYGALGAAWANGAAQTFAAVAIWSRVLIRYPVQVNTSVVFRLVGATLAMAVVVLGIVSLPFNAATKLLVAIPAGVIAFMITSRAFMVLESNDRRRLLELFMLLPERARPWFTPLVDFLVPSSPALEVPR